MGRVYRSPDEFVALEFEFEKETSLLRVASQVQPSGYFRIYIILSCVCVRKCAIVSVDQVSFCTDSMID